MNNLKEAHNICVLLIWAGNYKVSKKFESCGHQISQEAIIY
jgi:hypothetical protein